MGTRRIDIMIRKVRKGTGNEDYGANAGISDSQMEEYFNDGLGFLESGINQTHALQFISETFIDLVAGTEKYSLPADFLQGGGVVGIDYSYGNPSGSDPQWQPLNQTTDIERARGLRMEVPSSYMVVGTQVWINAIPSTNKTSALRVLYVSRLSRLGIRRGLVSAVTLNTGTRRITSLTVSGATTPDEYNLNESASVVDADGTIKMAGIKLSGAALAAGVVPVRSDFVYVAGETIAVGDYVVFGAKASTHQLQLDEAVERFLTAYAQWKVLREDSSDDSAEQLTELTAMRDSILSSYSKPNKDLILVPEC